MSSSRLIVSLERILIAEVYDFCGIRFCNVESRMVHCVNRAVALAFLASMAWAAPAAAFDKALQPVAPAIADAMKAHDMAPDAPIVMRVYKKEAVLEVWKQTRGGRYAFLQSFPICRWSGQLGPKQRAGDRQAPEGFYAISRRQMNPNSAYYLSFDTGYPNAYDRAHGGTGSALMVHGTCSSMGCYAMTDKQIAQIYALARDALAGGQQSFQFQAYPFRMSAENMARHRLDPHIDFWRQLKEGADRFEATGEEPVVSVKDGRYAFSSRTPALDARAVVFHAAEEARISKLVNDGSAAVRTTYADGGQNAIFAALAQKGENHGDISRPEALAYAGREVVMVPARRKPAPVIEAKFEPQADASTKPQLGEMQAEGDAKAEARQAEEKPVVLGNFALLAGAAQIRASDFAPWM